MNLRKKVRAVDICAYVECNNGRHKGHHLYRFPKEDSPLLKEWISKIGNPILKYYASATLRSMGVCADHFLPEMFKPNPKNTNERRRLKKNAIPESPEYLITIEEEDVQANQLVSEEQTTTEEGEEEEERYQHHHYYYQQQQEAEEREVEEREVEEEGENELFINKPTLDYTKAPLKFSDNEDLMEWIAVKSQMIRDAQLEDSTRKTFREMKLENKCAQLLKKNKNLKVQIKHLKRNFQRVKRSRDRFRKMSRKLETIDEFLDRYKCKNDTTRALVKSQLESESIKHITEEEDECEENN
ncbi:uncharacterized protein LOC122566230 [Bombus pyrosoma]|uniref:uncharacterized protein LOC122566230 n=1 Tax=Bombus pyrosoma TaxID=396416 RepID=UPI001CB8A144|nr:uncharacterized protein LOC122566230 [Bombus pyrosoma]